MAMTNRERFLMARAAESNYRSRLLQVSRQINALVQGHAQAGQDSLAQIQQSLRGYADLITPWAETVARYMVADVSRRNLKGWQVSGEAISRALLVELEQAPTGSIYAQLQQEQVELIRSLPLKAAARINHLATQSLVSGARSTELAKEVYATGKVTAARAKMIARTEVSRSSSNLVQARSVYVGSEGYIWRTSRDGDVRPTHRKQQGKFIRWSAPPKTDAGLAPYHAGCGPNCRCWPDPVLPDLY